MKKRSGCLNRILGIGILLGIIGAAGLGYMGYQKANTAEANATPVKELDTVYIGDTVIETDTDNLPSVVAPTAAYQSASTPKPGSNATPTPEPTNEIQFWSYPTVTPEAAQASYGSYQVGNLIDRKVRILR